MDTMALQHLNHSTVHFEDIAGKGAKQLTFNQIDLEQAGPYAAEDADITLQLHQFFAPQLAADEALNQVYQTIEVPLLPILSKIERHGALVDAAQLHQQSQQLAERLRELELDRL